MGISDLTVNIIVTAAKYWVLENLTSDGQSISYGDKIEARFKFSDLRLVNPSY